MKQQQIIDYATNINDQRMELLSRRNTDYSEQDVDNGLSNFHDVASICKTLGINIKASEVAMILAILKMVRDANKKRLGKDPDDDTRQDNARDLHNYLDLSTLCEMEEGDYMGTFADCLPSENKIISVLKDNKYEDGSVKKHSQVE